ncbi:MAG: ATP-binding protein [Limnobacter sp.]|uniref:PAS domain-containing sensor histidine kinase n=1 Tax=Limnobacter sp. TaxID=2003368 RepID=UPI00391C0F46
MVTNQPAFRDQDAVTHDRTRFGRTWLVLLLTGVMPTLLVGLAMAFHDATPQSWAMTLALASVGAMVVGLFITRPIIDSISGSRDEAMASERQLRQLMQLSGDWYWQQNTRHELTRIIHRGRDQDSNDSHAELPFHGLARWEVEGLRLADSRYTWESFRALLERHEPFDRVLFDYWPEGRKRVIFESTGRPLFSDNSEFCGYIGVSSDLTQKRLNEKMLSLQRSLLQGVLLSAPVPELCASYSKGLKNCLTAHADVLLGYREHAGLPRWRIRGTNPALHLSLDKGSQFWANPDQFCGPIEGHEQHGLVWLGQIKPEHYFDPSWSTSMGYSTIWVAIRKAVEPNQPEYWMMIAQKGPVPVVDDDVLRVLTAIRLLGLCVERRVFEDDLQTLNATLEQRIEARTAELQRSNSELEAFTYTVSHDLRAPLRAIDGFSSILREDFAAQLPEDANRLLDRISNNARQMGGLIDGLLDFSRLLRTDVALVPVNFAQLVEQVLEQLDAQARATVIVPALPVVKADPVLIRQVWMNLVDNALKFSAKVGSPTVTIEYERLGAIHRFKVRDNGAGFDMKYADKLFNVFERLHHKQDFDGTGVGLAIVKRIIDRHGGQIVARGCPGEGAEFEFTLPVEANVPEGKE